MICDSGHNTSEAGLSVNLVAGQSAVTELWCSNPIKLLIPKPRGPSVWAYLSSFGGGFVAGDQTRLELNVGAGASCFLTTQASTKIYRNPDRRPCSHRADVRVQTKSLLLWAPEPVQSFADSTYRQHQRFHVAADAGFVLLDWFCSGRAARGERWSFERLASRNEIFIDGKQCLLDSLLLDRSQGPLAGLHRLGRFNCVAMIAVIGLPLRKEAGSILDTLANSPIERRSSTIFCASPLADGILLRIAAEHQEDAARFVYRTLRFTAELLRDDPWARKMQMFDTN